jgi:hypothetical protein
MRRSAGHPPEGGRHTLGVDYLTRKVFFIVDACGSHT